MSEERTTADEDGGEAKPEERKISAGAELVIPVSGSIFAIYYFTTIWNSPWTAQVSAFFIGIVLMLLSTVVVIRTLLRVRAGTARFDFDRLIEPVDFLPRRLALLGLTIAYILGVEDIGFTVTTFVFLVLSMLLLNKGQNWRRIIAISFAMAVGGWALFVWAFEVRFPEGIFEELMKGIL